MVSIQYPHTLVVKFKADQATKDENGNWVSPTSATQLTGVRCRNQPNSKNTFLRGEDGKEVAVNSIIYVEGRISTVAIGSEVEVYEGSEMILKDIVIGFSRDSFHSRIWV